MPISASQSQPESAPIREAALDALLAGTEPPVDSAAGLQPVADALAALRAGPTEGELAGENAALARFRQQFGVPSHQLWSRPRRPRTLPALLTQRAAVIAVAAAVGLGGVLAVTVAVAEAPGGHAIGAHLTRSPGPTQGAGHHRAGPPTVQQVGQQQLGRLCSRYERSPGHSGGDGRSAAPWNLDHAAGGEVRLGRFCASLLRPGAGPGAPGHPNGKPAQHGKGKGKGKGNGNGGASGNGANNGNGGGNGNSGGNGNGGGNGGGNGNGNANGNGRAPGDGNSLGNRSGSGVKAHAKLRSSNAGKASGHGNGRGKGRGGKGNGNGSGPGNGHGGGGNSGHGHGHG